MQFARWLQYKVMVPKALKPNNMCAIHNQLQIQGALTSRSNFIENHWGR